MKNNDTPILISSNYPFIIITPKVLFLALGGITFMTHTCFFDQSCNKRVMHSYCPWCLIYICHGLTTQSNGFINRSPTSPIVLCQVGKIICRDVGKKITYNLGGVDIKWVGHLANKLKKPLHVANQLNVQPFFSL